MELYNKKNWTVSIFKIQVSQCINNNHKEQLIFVEQKNDWHWIKAQLLHATDFSLHVKKKKRLKLYYIYRVSNKSLKLKAQMHLDMY